MKRIERLAYKQGQMRLRLENERVQIRELLMQARRDRKLAARNRAERWMVEFWSEWFAIADEYQHPRDITFPVPHDARRLR